MLKKLITRLKSGSCKTKVLDDANASDESKKEKNTAEGN